MSQQVLNSTENIGIPHGISVWFQQDYTGTYKELGDLVAAGVSLTPEFVEHNSYRNGLRALRKKVLTKKNASINLTLNEPNILNLQRVLFGGTVATSVDNVTVEEGRIMTLDTDGASGLTVDFSDISETEFSSITVVGVYDLDDPTYADNLISGNKTPNSTTGVCTLGTSPLGQSGATHGPEDGEDVYVRYQIDTDTMYSTELFGATDATIEGAAKLQVRNQSGGVVQIWNFNSVQLSSNGDITFPLDSIQTLPMTMSLLERNGSFGTVYVK